MNSIIKSCLMVVTLSMLTAACGLKNAHKDHKNNKCTSNESECWQIDSIHGPLSTIEYSSKNMGMFHFKITQDAQNVFSMKMLKTKTLDNDYSFYLKNLTQEQQTQLSHYFEGKTKIEGTRHWIGPKNLEPLGCLAPEEEITTLNVQMKGHGEFTLSQDSILENLILDLYYQNLGTEIAYDLKSASYNLKSRVCYNKSNNLDLPFEAEAQDGLDLNKDQLTLDLNVATKSGLRTIYLSTPNTHETANLTLTDLDLQKWSRTIAFNQHTLMTFTIESEVITQEGAACPVGYSLYSTFEEHRDYYLNDAQ